MITIDKIKPYMVGLATASGCNLHRESQKGDRPPYPVMTYRIISAPVDDDWMEFRSSESVAEGAQITGSRRASGTVSLNFLSPTQTAAETAARAGFGWIMSVAARDIAAPSEIVVRQIGAAPEDRTAQLESGNFECRVGFDVRIDTVFVRQETTERIDQITITGGPDGETPDEIVVEE